MNNLRFIKLLLFYTLLLLMVVACGGDAPPAAEVETVDQPTTAAEAEAPTAVPATPTLSPTLPPPVVATPVPTSTPAEEMTEVEDEGIVLDSPEDFAAENRNPLTGEIVDDPSMLERRPLAIKISNAPPSYVRPQSGLNDADIMFEHITEAVVTRFTAIFYSKDPATVGPIRSARLIDVELPAMYDAALGYSGSSNGVANKLFASDFAGRILRPGAQGYYRTGDTSKPYEHTFYAYTDQLRQSLGDLNRPPQFGTGMTFTSEPPAGGSEATQIDVNYKWETVRWTYDPETNLYYREAGGAPHIDANTGEQVQARNIIVPFVNHVDSNICEQISAEGVCQLLSVEIQLWGQGQVIIFRDGQRYDGIWKRDARNDMLTFYDNEGNPIPLQIGNTWVQLMSIYYSDPLTVTP